MKITNVQAMVARVFTVGLLAGAVVLAAPAKAEAQVRVGVEIAPPVRFRGPVYVAPRPVYGYYGGGFYGRPLYGPRFDHDRRDFDRDRRFHR